MGFHTRQTDLDALPRKFRLNIIYRKQVTKKKISIYTDQLPIHFPLEVGENFKQENPVSQKIGDILKSPTVLKVPLSYAFQPTSDVESP